MKAERDEKVTDGWIMGFKQRSHLYNTKAQDDTESNDGDVSAKHVEDLAKIIDGSCYNHSISL